jgi:hypothetical protein
LPRRTISLYAIHGHTRSGTLDYREFFEWFSGLQPADTRYLVWEDLVFVRENRSRLRDKHVFEFISGDPNEQPLFYDDVAGAVSRGDLPDDSWPARQTRVVVDPTSRIMAVEARRAGVSARNLERYFERLARDRGFAHGVSLTLAPLQTAGFTEELEQFTRIREATIVIRRPNFDWDDARDQITELAGESNGQTAETTVNAGRNQSLSKDDGIISIIKRHVRRPLTSIIRATIVGNKQGEEGEVHLSTGRHNKRRYVAVPDRSSELEIARLIIDEAADAIEDALGGGDGHQAD